MPVPLLSELVTPIPREDVLELELQLAQTLGLTVTAWQQLGIARTIYATDAANISSLSETINFIAQGGYASYAAQMVDANGDPVTTWMDLVSFEVYNVTRQEADFAETDSAGFSVSNTSGTAYGPFGVGELHFSNSSTGAKYHNTEAVSTIAALGATPVAIIADVAGSGSSAGVNDVDTLDTPLVGCGCANSVALVGSDAETNSQLLQRDQAKLGSLSPNGPPSAYDFVAKSILDPTQRFYNPDLSQRITRVKEIPSAGTVNVYVANDAGAPGAGDITIVDDAIQAWAVPLGVTAVVQAATNLTIAITYTAYLPAAAGATSGQVTTAAAAALAALFKALPIGGVVETSANEVPLETIRGTIFAAIAALVPAYSYAVSVLVSLPAGDTSVVTTEVPVLGAVTPTVNFT